MFMDKVITKAKLSQLRISPRKVRLLIDHIRGMKARQAVVQLQFSKKHASRPVLKLLQSAMANARHNHALKEETLVIKQAFVDGGPILYRWMPRAMGRATPIRKRTSHITIVLEGDVDEKAAKAKEQEIKKAKKQESKKEEDEKKEKGKEEDEIKGEVVESNKEKLEGKVEEKEVK
jgi:large subunit ribosomal protein L22